MKRSAQQGSWSAWTPTSRRLASLLPFLFLTACATTGTVQTPVPKVSAPEQCLQGAPSLPMLVEKATLADAVRNHAEVAAAYWQLAEWHTCLIMFERGR